MDLEWLLQELELQRSGELPEAPDPQVAQAPPEPQVDLEAERARALAAAHAFLQQRAQQESAPSRGMDLSPELVRDAVILQSVLARKR